MSPKPSSIGTDANPLGLDWLRVHVQQLADQLAQVKRVQSRLEYRYEQVGHQIKDASIGLALQEQYARQIARQRNVVEALHEQYQIARARLSVLEDASV